MKNYIVKVECTYEFEIEISGASSKAEAIKIATTDVIKEMSMGDMTFKKAKAKVVDYYLDE